MNAKHFVVITGWWLDLETELIPTYSLRNLLVEKLQNDDFQVHIILWADWLSSIATSLNLKNHEVKICEEVNKKKGIWKLFGKNEKKLKNFHCDTRHRRLTTTHHQKSVVVDNEIAFLGGLDICPHRWDTQQHPIFPSPREVVVTGYSYHAHFNPEGNSHISGPRNIRLPCTIYYNILVELN